MARGPEQATSVGTFLGPAKHDVAIPFDRLKLSSTSHVLVLAGATKEVLTAMPKFEYAKKDGGLQRREVSISMLDARAGSPPTAARLLCRHCGDGSQDLLELLRDWERWSAELLESHISFPVLSYFRSQHDNQSWVAALTTVLDVCALIVARIDERPVTTARLTFAMARHAVLDLCAVFRLEPASPPRDRLPAAEEKRLEGILAAMNVRLRSDETSVAKLMSAHTRGFVRTGAALTPSPSAAAGASRSCSDQQARGIRGRRRA